MTIKPSLPIFVGVLLTFSSVQGSSPDRVGGYDFSYTLSGDQRVRPAQVFDDGKSTFFQFRPGEIIPAIFADASGGPVLLMPSMEGPYVRVTTVASGYVLRMGYGVGRATYSGSGRGQIPADNNESLPTIAPNTARLMAASSVVQGMPKEMFEEPPRVSLETNSYAVPRKGDRVEWTNPEKASQDYSIAFATGVSKLSPQAVSVVRSLAASMNGAVRIQITGRDDSTYKEGLSEARASAVADLLASSGIPRSRLVIKTSPELKTGSGKGLVVGASIVAFSVAPYVAQPAPAQVGRSSAVANIVAKLQGGSITPSEALKALDEVRAHGFADGASNSGSTAAVSAPPKKWLVRAADGTVEAMLRRWGSENGWKVVGKGAPEIKINGDAELERADFLKAADYAITQAKQAGYRIKATAYSNQVLVLTEEGSK